MRTCPTHDEPMHQLLSKGRPNGWRCPSCFREYHRAWSKAHPRPARSRPLREYRAEAIAARGGACSRCGYADCRALQFDHTNGDGQQDRGGGRMRQLYRAIARGERPDVVLLCANCHAIDTHTRAGWSC